MILSTTSTTDGSSIHVRHLRDNFCNFKASKSEGIGVFATEAVCSLQQSLTMFLLQTFISKNIQCSVSINQMLTRR